MILERFKDYIDSNKLEIHIDDLGIYVLNYKKILSFLDTKIIITDNIKNVSIIGNKLVISKLKKEELYITGDIYEVVLR
ncbi:MAG: YabP/YqfC family sporulation protein [bacterium]|nr:YabP/YqfC family sporulation protein [bacterium]MDY4108422.1 YabP/YqfC family sporulation protein [Bacilli bacterium]